MPMRVEELQHVDRGRRRADVDGDRLVEPEHLAQICEQVGVGRGHLRLELLGHRLALLTEPDTLYGGVQGLLDGSPLLRGLCGLHRLQTRLELLPDPRYGEEPVRTHLGQV